MGSKLDPSIIALEHLTEEEQIIVDTAIEAALRRVRSMRLYGIPPSLSNTLISSLTPREREVLPLFSAGYSAREIGLRLNISARTAEVHRENILAKLGLSKVIDVVHMMSVAG